MTLEQQRMALEQITISKVAFDAISIGKQEMERANKNMSVEKVEETMDDLQEQIELQQETADALARPINAFGVTEDEVRARRRAPVGRAARRSPADARRSAAPSGRPLVRAGRAHARARGARAGDARRAHPPNRRLGRAARRRR